MQTSGAALTQERFFWQSQLLADHSSCVYSERRVKSIQDLICKSFVSGKQHLLCCLLPVVIFGWKVIRSALAVWFQGDICLKGLNFVLFRADIVKDDLNGYFPALSG